MLSCTSSINPQDIKFKIITVLQTYNGKSKRKVVILANIDISFTGVSLKTQNVRVIAHCRPAVKSSLSFLCTSTLVRVVTQYDIS